MNLEKEAPGKRGACREERQDGQVVRTQVCALRGWVQHHPVPQTFCRTVGESLRFSVPRFSICKMGIVTHYGVWVTLARLK